MKRIGLVCMLLALGMLPSAVCSADEATAIISGTSDDTSVSGVVTLTDTPMGLQIVAEVSQATPGTHGFHIHEFGGCADGGKAAGGHFNPDSMNHGNLLTGGFKNAHAGDLGNLQVDEDGHGAVQQVYRGLSVSGGRYAVAGRAFILHAKPDDFGQPTGNAGGRIACGSILITGH